MAIKLKVVEVENYPDNMRLCKKIWNFFSNLVLKNRLAVFLLVLLFLITFLVVLPIPCRKLVYSKYFHMMAAPSTSELKNRAQDVNEYRALLATYHLSNLDANKTLSYFRNLQKSGSVEIAVGIVTVRRQHRSQLLGYLTQVVSKTIQIFEADTSFSRKVLFLCNTFAGPGIHVEANHLAKFVPVFNRFHPGNTQKDAHFDRFEKEKQDYNYCLLQALKYKPKYVIIIEDDAVPRPDFFIVLRYILDNLIENKLSMGERVPVRAPWAYLKLYYPERWQGFSNESQRLFELFGIGCIGGTIFLCACRIRVGRRDLSPATCLIMFMLGAVYFMLIAILIGRQYLVNLRHNISPYLYTVIVAPDCCSPGILYSNKMATDLIEYLSKRTCSANFPIDFALDQFAIAHNYQHFLVEPNLLTHIGMISSLRSKPKRPEEFIF